MSSSAPLVTVVLVTCDSEAFVADAIDSVLSQSGVALELLVGDDASGDGAVTSVKRRQDERLQVVTSPTARGRASMLNELVERARGEFVAIIQPADAWIGSDKLSRQVELLQSRSDLGATFGRARLPAGQGTAPRSDLASLAGGSEPASGSRARWLRHLLLVGNDLCLSSVLLRREAFRKVGGCDDRLRETLDLDLWTRLARQWNLHLSDRELVQCREPDRSSIESMSPRLIRQRNEEYLVYASFFDGLDAALLRAGFSDLMVNPQATSAEELAVEKALLLFKADGQSQSACWTLGLERVYALLGDERYRPALRAHGIDEPWLHAKMAQFSPFFPEVEPDASPLPGPPRAAGLLRSWMSSLGR